MSDEIAISSGGAVAVDPASLEEAATEFGALARLLTEAADLVRGALALLDLAGSAVMLQIALGGPAERVADTAWAMQRRLGEAAAVYELVELNVQRAAVAASGDGIALARLDRRIATLHADWPAAGTAASEVVRGWATGWDDEVVRQSAEGGRMLGLPAAALSLLLAQGAAAWIARARLSRIPGDAVLRGRAPVPPMTETWRGPAAAPASLADLAVRIPPGPDRVRVERYAMPDGTTRFAVYVAGTQGFIGEEPWDMTSNLHLYQGEQSDSYAAVEAALRAAGARAGDVVYAVGHSQGAMIASRLAVEGGYDTRAIVTFGSPVEAEVGTGTLSVQVRHRDDPVSFLAGSGAPLPVGADGGFIVERTVDEHGRPGDLLLGSHQLDQYTETARLADASGDPRVGTLHELLGELAGAQGFGEVWAPELSRSGSAGAG